jgi:hypothetical protein
MLPLAVEGKIYNIVVPLGVGDTGVRWGLPSDLRPWGGATSSALERLLNPRGRTRSHRTESAYMVREGTAGTAVEVGGFGAGGEGGRIWEDERRGEERRRRRGTALDSTRPGGEGVGRR